jgi:putative nucleotidyltransferase with HDIG domain
VKELSAQERAARLERQQALTGLRALARAVDAKDQSTREHSERVAELAARIAGELGWGDESRAKLHEAGLLHDVGKIRVPDAVLFKPGALSDREYDQVKQHAALGAEIADEVLAPDQVAWIRGHHERWDGRGYPDGLAGPTIPQGARILALADAWDVMTSVRSYKEPRRVEEALVEVRRHHGTQFAPEIVDAMERLWNDGQLVPPPPPTGRNGHGVDGTANGNGNGHGNGAQ